MLSDRGARDRWRSAWAAFLQFVRYLSKKKEGRVHIVADRFVVTNEEYATDLVTGAPVILRIGSGGGPAEQARWSIRCRALHELHHRALAPLVDYGGIGPSQRFEAWGCGRSWNGGRRAGAAALSAASWFLRACGLTDGTHAAAEVREADGRAVMLPGDEAGYLSDKAEVEVGSAARGG